MAGKRMTFQQRVIIQTLLEDSRNTSLASISEVSGLNRVTIYNEILSRRVSLGSKQEKFLRVKPNLCQLLKKYPFCCNTCNYKGKCTKEIFIYDAYNAHEIFEHTKHSCSKGPSISNEQLQEIDEKVSPRVLMGQSLYHIKSSDSSLKVSEQTIRRYIKDGYLQCKVIDLPRTVQRKPKDIINPKRPRLPVQLLLGRTYDDFIKYKNTHHGLKIIQIDTVIGKRNDKKVILTIFEPISRLQFAILVYRGSEAINRALLELLRKLNNVNKELFNVIVTDNGCEFLDLPLLEYDEKGVLQFKVFYCDPYSSWQKGGCERNHEFFRYIKRKGISLDTLTQFELNTIFSNINSLRRKSLNGSTPYEVFKNLYGVEVLEIIGIDFIEPLNVILKQ